MKEREYAKNFILIIAALFSSLPLFIPGIEGHFGQDLGFHINRIEGIYLELLNGQFPVRMQSFWMDGYGYPVSIYYGDFFLYFPALLRLLGVPVVAAYKAYLLTVNVLTVLISYHCFFRMTGDRSLGAIGAFVYATTNYRLLDLYIRAAVGEYTAMAFLPLVVYGVWLIYGDECRRAIVPLVTGMSGILLSHIMTLEITGICLIVICIFNLKKTFSPEVLSTYIISAGMTGLLTLFFTVPFLDYFMNESVRINEVVGNARQIQESGTRLYEFFDFFMIPFSNLDPAISDDRMLTTPGMVLMGTFIAGVAVCVVSVFRGKRDDRTRAIYGLTIASAVLLFVSSDMFPWNRLGRSGAVGDLLAQVQFPWRYIGMATVMLSILLLLLIGGSKRTAAVVISVAAVMCVWFTGVYAKYAELDIFADTEDLDTFDMGFIEYLRPDAVREDFTHEIRVTAGEAEEITELYRQGTSMDVYVNAPDGATVELPVLNYRYYYVTDESGKSYELSDGENDEISIDVDAGFDGVVSLYYEPPVFWHVAEWISLLSFVAFLVWLWKRYRVKK